MRVFLDTCVFDWIVDEARGKELLARLTDPATEVVVFPEVSKELHDIPEAKAERRRRLLELLERFLPVRPTHIPVMGLARVGASRRATAEATSLREELRAKGFRKLDSLHLINAHLERCDLFITNDKEDLLRRRSALEARLGFQILTPQELLARLSSGGPS